MKLLAIDTSTEACSVAFSSGGQAIGRYEVLKRAHHARVLPMVQSVLAEGGCSLTALDALVVTVGPGSFTGVRIGVGVAQGLALSCDLPVVAVSTLAVIAQTAHRLFKSRSILSLVRATGGELYGGWYILGENGLMECRLGDARFLEEALFPLCRYSAGPFWLEKYSNPSQSGGHIYPIYPHAQDCLGLGGNYFNLGRFQPASQINPVYLSGTAPWSKVSSLEN